MMANPKKLLDLLTFQPQYKWAVIDMSDFRGIVFDVARIAGARIIDDSFLSARLGQNYFSVTVELSSKKQAVKILASSGYPVFAFSTAGEVLSFMDSPELDLAFSECHPQFKIMRLTELNTRIRGLSLDGLSETLVDDLKYWTPDTLGEVLFNIWD